MYYLNINGLKEESKLEKIYRSIDKFNLNKEMFVSYNITINKIEDFRFNLQNTKAHIYILDMNMLEVYCDNMDKIEDLFLDIIEMDINLYVKEYLGKNYEFKLKLENIISNFGLIYSLYEPFNFSKDIDLKNLSYIDYQIVLEILENKKYKEGPFNIGMFAVKVEINESGVVFVENRHALDLNNDNFFNILFYKNDDVVKNLEIIYNQENFKLSSNWYEPVSFILNDVKINEKIVEYKYKVFEKIKNISPKEYPLINETLINLLNVNSYVPMDYILKEIGVFKNDI